MKVTLTGGNSFGLRGELDKLVANFLDEHGDMALERLDGEEATFERMQEALQSLPFLASKKMVVLRGPSANKQFAENAERLLTELPETTDVILAEPKLDKRLAYYKFLKKATDFREFVPLDASGLARWLMQAAKDRGGSLSSSEASFLVNRVGANQQLLGNELEKLALYDPKITRANIELLTEATPQSTIFELLEAAFAGNTKRAFKLYEEQRALKVEPQQIIAMLAWQLHILALVKTAGDRTSDQIAREAKLNPYVVRKSAAIARKLSLPELKTLIANLLEIDTRLKREPINADEALQNYLLQLASR
ncbi:MAG TPA: DNA polymerase III subunit delta [Candidatus Saccharimonadales bacterium]